MKTKTTNGTTKKVKETLTPEVGYALPETIGVEGATSEYNSSTGEVTLTQLESETVVTASGAEVPVKAVKITAPFDKKKRKSGFYI